MSRMKSRFTTHHTTHQRTYRPIYALAPTRYLRSRRTLYPPGVRTLWILPIQPSCTSPLNDVSVIVLRRIRQRVSGLFEYRIWKKSSLEKHLKFVDDLRSRASETIQGHDLQDREDYRDLKICPQDQWLVLENFILVRGYFNLGFR